MTAITPDNDTFPIFLLGSGRSGTTLIQRLLNSYEDTMIWGEHDGFLSHLAQSYFLLKHSPAMAEYSYDLMPDIQTKKLAGFFKDPCIWQAWTNWFRKDDLPAVYRQIVEMFFNNSRITRFHYWGFKEIRYGSDPAVINFLQELYPNAVFLIITRNGLNTIESQLTHFHRGNSRFIKIKRLLQLPLIIELSREWASQNRYYEEMISSGNRQIVHINYNRISESGYLENKFCEFRKTFGPAQHEILELKSGRGTAMKDGTTENERWRRMGFIPSFVINLFIKTINDSLNR